MRKSWVCIFPNMKKKLPHNSGKTKRKFGKGWLLNIVPFCSAEIYMIMRNIVYSAQKNSKNNTEKIAITRCYIKNTFVRLQFVLNCCFCKYTVFFIFSSFSSCIYRCYLLEKNRICPWMRMSFHIYGDPFGDEFEKKWAMIWMVGKNSDGYGHMRIVFNIEWEETALRSCQIKPIQKTLPNEEEKSLQKFCV